MIDARISIGLPQHPKTKKLIKRLGDGAAWRLICLFLWAAANKPDGNLSGMTTEDIELAVDWPGEDGAFVAAMIEVGFIDGEDGNYAIHDWREHNPWAAGADARSEKARWLATCKHHGKEKAAELMPDYAERLQKSASSRQIADDKQSVSMLESENSSAPSPSPSPSPLPSPKSSISEQTTSTTNTARDVANISPSSLPDLQTRCKTLASMLAKLESERTGKQVRSILGHQSLVAWVQAGITDHQFREAYDLAVEERVAAADASPVNIGFLDIFVGKVMIPSDAPSSVTGVKKAWHESAAGIEAKGKELGIPDPDPATGGFPAFKARVFKAAGVGAAV